MSRKEIIYTVMVPENYNGVYTLKKTVIPRKESYNGDVDSVYGIALWFYTNHHYLNPKELEIEIIGGWHKTFPNPDHIRVQLRYFDERNNNHVLLNPFFNNSTYFHFSQKRMS